MTVTEEELKIAKDNISHMIMECYLDVDRGFKSLAETPLKSFNAKKNELQENIQKSLTDLNQKIKKELI